MTLKERSLFSLLLLSVIFLIYTQIKLGKRIINLNYQIDSLLNTQPKTIIKTRLIEKEERPVYVPSEGRVIIREERDNKANIVKVNIEVKKWGFIFRPGLQVGHYPSLGLDGKVLFYNRLGLNTGFLYGFGDYSLYPTLSLSYKLDRIPLIENLEFQTGFRFFKAVGGFYLGFRINL